MTAVAPPQSSNMDLLRADDQMDLASSPAMPLEDVDFELDDVGETSAEPNQDLMLQDEPEQSAAVSDIMRSSPSDHADDDLMVDEDTILQQENDTDLFDLTEDVHEDQRTFAEEDDDILYEDEEVLQEHEIRSEDLSKEQEMGAIDIEILPVNQQVQIIGDAGDDLAASDIVAHAEDHSSGAEMTNSAAQARPALLAEDTVYANNEEATVKSGFIAAVNEGQDSSSLENIYARSNHHVDANGNDEGENEVIPNNQPDLEGDAVAINKSNPPSRKESDDSLLAGALESQADLSTNSEEGFDESAPHTPLLHPVKVHYLGTEMCLFPPTEDDESEMFFLEDVSLAQESLDKMLGACRDVLANAIGQDDELVLDVASLGLHISEGSTYATAITLSQIIDVYVALAHNDKIANLEPLHCSLSSRVCLSSQYAYLQSAAKEGKTLTQIVDETTFASAENGGDGLDYEHAEHADQEASKECEQKVEPIPLKEAVDTLPLPTQTSNEESRNDEVSSPNRGSNQQSEARPAEDSAAEPSENKVDELRSAMPYDQGQSATSTVKGDDEDFEDTAAVVSDNDDSDDNDEITEDLFARTVQSTDDSRPPGPSTGQVPKDVSKPAMEGNRRDSVSSRTLETESNQLEEDLFSQNDDQLSGEEHSNSPEIEDGDVEDFELEEQDFEDAGFELDDSHGTQSDPAPAHHDLDSADVQNGTRSEHVDEHDDELWNFGEEGKKDEVQEELQENSLSTYQPELPPIEALLSHDGTDTHQNDFNSPKKHSLSQVNKRYSSQSPLGQITNDTLAEAADDSPNTPSGGKNGFKRKAFEDDDDFDLLDTATPDKKRRRPS